ncbi:hypothetical protein NQ661_16725 [Acinetobacter baumannii]|uniref:hypothetical protein n=1 Tax=Acinetobacter baumannii TaxID=470 RepID=UPI00135F6A38|nr:hypothetical protein [Acinetobacter baumannii]MDC4325538.1 hypothetical protein [Acinetobacter baumannii]CAA0221869.1 hypothetical protein AB571B5_02011 [Acinetobacter baumannii]
MLLEKIRSVQINLLEIVTVIFFLALGYCLFYKYSFYNALGIPWFITNITPQFLFLTSLKLLFITIIFSLLGYLFASIGNTLSIRKIIYLIFLVLFILMGIFYQYTIQSNKQMSSTFYSVRYSDIFYCFYIFSCGLLSTLFYKVIKSKDPNNEFKISRISKKIKIFAHLFIVSMGLILLLQPIYFGLLEANNILQNRQTSLNKTKLKSLNQDWYVIETMGEKFLLIDNNNKIKIIEYKDIEYIQRTE